MLISYVRGLLFITFLMTICKASALPAPMSDKELLESSDFVGEVKVIGVVATEDDKSTYKGITVARYNAWLQVTKTIKGHFSPLDTIVACWHEIPKPPFVGAWYVGFALQEHTVIYLKLQDDRRCYTAVSWNAKKPLK
jgi:hypothetical protein